MESTLSFSSPTKRCSECGEEDPSKFYASKAKCKRCFNKGRTRWRATPSTQEQRRAWQIQYTYGVTPEEFSLLVERQEGLCPCCSEPLKLDLTGPNGVHLDHDHNTKVIRGILCAPCNKALGFARDNVDTLKRMIDYLGGPE